MKTKVRKRNYITVTTDVDVDISEILDEIDTEDLFEELKARGISGVNFTTLRDQELYDKFIELKEKYSYEELLNRLK
jgi:hypothetical protein